MKLEKEQLLTLYRNLVRARAWDQLFIRRLSEGKLLAFYHAAYGGEAPGVGACSFLRKDDILWPHHRGHGLPHMIGKGIDPTTYLAEHCGKATGCCMGLSSFHNAYVDYGVYGVSGNIGSAFPLSLGWAWAAQRNGRQQVAVCCFGDGAFCRGTFHESVLMAANMKLPLILVCENNEVQEMTALDEVVSLENLADLAAGYGMPTTVVDGQDVVAVAEAALDAVARAREGQGPTFIECKTQRYTAHAIGVPDYYCDNLRTDEEIEALKKTTDPITVCQKKLLKQKVLTKKLIAEIDAAVAVETQAAEETVDAAGDQDATFLGPNLVYAD